MPDLNFSSRVLGSARRRRLRAHRVTQTVRNFGSSRFFSSRGAVVRITLDEEEIGQARITDISKRSTHPTEQFDAEIGGFLGCERPSRRTRRKSFQVQGALRVLRDKDTISVCGWMKMEVR